MREITDSQTIKQVQQKFKEKGQDVESDGSMGPKTKKAVTEFQQKQGMQASGTLDEETAKALGVQSSPQ